MSSLFFSRIDGGAHVTVSAGVYFANERLTYQYFNFLPSMELNVRFKFKLQLRSKLPLSLKVSVDVEVDV